MALSPAELAVSVCPVPDLVIAQPEKLATPELSLALSPPVQLRAPPAGLVPIASVMERPTSLVSGLLF